MAGSLVGNIPAITPIEKGRHGYIALSISNYDNNNEPQGQGNVEVAGGLYEFGTLESITGWSGIANSTDNIYIKTVPAGTSITLAFTTTAPAWSDTKQSWYSPTGGEEDHRYTNFKLDKDGSGNYVNKREWGYFKRGGNLDVDGYLTGERRILHIQDQKTSGTTGGSFTQGAWRTRDLNTLVTDTITGASLSSNQISLPAGSYIIKAHAPGHRVGSHRIRLRNITAGSTICNGSTEYVDYDTPINNRSFINIKYTFSILTIIELQHRCSITGGVGFGFASSFGINEIYADVFIHKIR
jgi:hypothetical protein